MSNQSQNTISDQSIEDHNSDQISRLNKDYDYLTESLCTKNVNIEGITKKVQAFAVALPSWGVGTGGTRFARFPGIGEPRNIFEKVDDCAVIHQLTQATPSISLHIPWDIPSDTKELKQKVENYSMHFDAMNSNTFQDQIEQQHSYKFGSLTHTNKDTRQQAIEHNIEVIELGKELGSKALTVWIADGSNFPGQQNFADSFSRYIESMKQIYKVLPDDWQMFIEHKIFEPAFYSTVIQDWGSSYLATTELGSKANCLVDLGHHAPNVNIEMIVSRLAQFKKLGGFHFNDSKYGDDDLDSGSINPYQLFLIFNELVEINAKDPAFSPAYMLDQSHNITDPIESLMLSAVELTRNYAKALIIDRALLQEHQQNNDVIMSNQLMKNAFHTDVEAILAMARYRSGGAINPLTCYRESGYRKHKSIQRPQSKNPSSGIV
jgi:L-rhamnose isomerase/sugar isomerase